MTQQKLKLLIAFLFGFTIWMPFLFLALRECPYKLVMLGADVGSQWWGWERRTDLVYNSHIIDGAYQGYGALLLFYGMYFGLIASGYVFAKYILIESKSPKNESLKEDLK
jgi:hypothetical protein